MDKSQFTHFVYTILQENPTWLRDTIDAASSGVTSFADQQTDKVTHSRALLLDILDSNDKVKVSRFDISDVLDDVGVFIGGTEGLKNLEKKHLTKGSKK